MLDSLESMRAVLTAVVAAIEACAVAIAGVVLVAVPVLLLWWLSFDLAVEPEVPIAATAGVWLLAHFVPLTLGFDAETALGLGLAPEALSFTLSLTPLGITLLTVGLAFRAGWRFGGRGTTGAAGVLGGIIGFAAVTFGIIALGAPPLAVPVWAAVLFPALCYGAGVLSGFLARSVAAAQEWWLLAVRQVQRAIEPLSSAAAAALPARAAAVFRLAAAGGAAVAGLGALGVFAAILVGYVDIVTLSQSLQLDPLGAVVLLLLNLALLPTLCIWAVAWFSGAGFSLGTGTSVSPFETLLGPVPALPIFGAIPQGWGWAAALAPLLVVIVGLVIGTLAGATLRRASLVRAIVTPLAAAVLVGLAFTALSALASGAIGPGRMAETGPSPWLVGGLVAAELGGGMVFGILARRADLGRFARWREPGETAAEVPLEPPSPQPIQGQAAAPDPGAPAEAETVPIDPVSIDPVPAETVPAETAPAETVPVDPAEAPASADTETLLRAYAWDRGAAEATADPPPARRSIWRLPRRKG